MRESKRFFGDLKKAFCLIFFIFLSVSLSEAKTAEMFDENYSVDLVVFSYDRPLQLYSCLESIEHYVRGYRDIFVIYRTSDNEFESAYQEVKRNFPDIKMIKQDLKRPKKKFKPLLLKILFKESESRYVSFVVDDIIVKDVVDLRICAQALRRYEAYGFYLQLGRNIIENYATSTKSIALPKFEKCSSSILSWDFTDKIKYDWKRIGSLDMSIYNKRSLRILFKEIDYNSPNTLEASWIKNIDVSDKKGLCFKQSKIVNIPLNIVQSDFDNLHMEGFPTRKLLEIFKGGYKIDIKEFFKIDNKSLHMYYEPSFILRKRLPAPLWKELKNYKEEKENHIVVVVPSYNNKLWYRANLNSLITQKYRNFNVIYIDDASSDGTGQLVQDYIKEKGQENRILLIRNQERCRALANIYKAVHMCDDESIILTVDGDDSLANNHVLDLINKVYDKYKVWLTYGQFVRYFSGELGFCQEIPEEIVRERLFRSFRWVTSQLRTFYAWLFKSIRREDLLYEDSFFSMTYDLAMMFPMLEMVNGRFKFIPDVLYIYNQDNPINDKKVDRELCLELARYIRTLPKYESLIEEKISNL